MKNRLKAKTLQCYTHDLVVHQYIMLGAFLDMNISTGFQREQINFRFNKLCVRVVRIDGLRTHKRHCFEIQLTLVSVSCDFGGGIILPINFKT